MMRACFCYPNDYEKLVKVSGKYFSEYHVANLCKEDPDIGSSVFSEDKARVCLCVCVCVCGGGGCGGVHYHT